MISPNRFTKSKMKLYLHIWDDLKSRATVFMRAVLEFASVCNELQF